MSVKIKSCASLEGVASARSRSSWKAKAGRADQEFKVIVNLTSAWTTQDTISKQKDK